MDGMSALLIRGIDDKLKRALRLRAADNGRSMEEEMRHILRAALGVPLPEQEFARQLDAIEAANKARGRQSG
jgi:antitoxin FitA